MGRINVYNAGDLKAAIAENDSRVALIGEVFLSHKRAGEFLIKDEYQGKNLITTEGMKYILDSSVGGVSAITPWYVGIFKGSAYTPAASNTAVTTLGTGGGAECTECPDTDYTPATNRPAFTIAAASGTTTVLITNTASAAAFTLLTGTEGSPTTIYGAFIASSQAKMATTGKLLAIKKFTAARACIATDVLSVVYQLSLVSS